MFADTRETETVFGPVIQAGLEALKVCVFVGFFLYKPYTGIENIVIYSCL